MAAKKRSLFKKIILVIVIVLIIKVLQEIITWGGFFWGKAGNENINISNRPIFNAPYKEVPEDVKNAFFDCNKYKLIPYANKKYICQNLYQTDEEKLKIKTNKKQAERIFLYGQHLYFDCFINPKRARDPVGDCYKAAKFLDNWQIEKMAQVLGVNIPKEKIYYYLSETSDELKEICGRFGAVTDRVSGCSIRSFNQIFAQGPGPNNSYFLDIFTNKFLLKHAVNSPLITYKAQVTYPANCFTFDLHEIEHVLNKEVFDNNTPEWFEEGLIFLLYEPMRKQICPPGSSLTNITKTENDRTTKVTEELSFDSFNLEEPLPSKLVELSENIQCRKGIYMQIARNLKIIGINYIKTLYDVFRVTKPVSEQTTAKAVWESSGKSTEVKDFLLKNNCQL